MNLYLRRHALANHAAGAGRTYVAIFGDEVVGYYTLSAGQVSHDEAPERISKGLAHHPIPVLLVARLAVALTWQGQGVGGGLIKDAMVRAVAAADIAGIRAIYVEAKDEAARRFYERFDFIASEDEPNHLFLLMKQARLSVAKRAPAP